MQGAVVHLATEKASAAGVRLICNATLHDNDEQGCCNKDADNIAQVMHMDRLINCKRDGKWGQHVHYPIAADGRGKVHFVDW